MCLGAAGTMGPGVSVTIAAPSGSRQLHAITGLQHMTPELGRQAHLADRSGIEDEGRAPSRASTLESPRRHLRSLEGGEELRFVIEDFDRPTDATASTEPTITPTSFDQGGLLDEQRILALQAFHGKIRGVRGVDLDRIEPVRLRQGTASTADRFQVDVVAPGLWIGSGEGPRGV